MCESVRICIFINLLTPLLWVQLQHRLRTTNNFPSSSILQVARYSWGWKLFPPFLLNTESKVLILLLQIDTVLPGFSENKAMVAAEACHQFYHHCGPVHYCPSQKCRKESGLAKWKVLLVSNLCKKIQLWHI